MMKKGAEATEAAEATKERLAESGDFLLFSGDGNRRAD